MQFDPFMSVFQELVVKIDLELKSFMGGFFYDELLLLCVEMVEEIVSDLFEVFLLWIRELQWVDGDVGVHAHVVKGTLS